MVGFSDVTDVVGKWTTIPFGLLCVMAAGSALNLEERLREYTGSQETNDYFSLVVRNLVQLGYYSGFLSGILVDRLPSMLAFIIAACLSALSYGTMGLLVTMENNQGIQILLSIHLLIAGYAAGLATINALVSTIKNFNRVVAILPIALFISYMKLSKDFDNAIKYVFFNEADLTHYLLYLAAVTAGIYVAALFFCRKIDMTKEHQRECADSDGYGITVFYIILALYIAYIFVGVYIFESEGAGFFATLVFMIMNFVAIVPCSVIQLSQMDDENSALPEGDKMSFRQYVLSPRYWALCISSFGIIGVCYSMNDYKGYDQLLGENEGRADRVFWLCDMLGRYFGGILVFATASFFNEYVWAMAYSIMGFLGTILIFAMTMTDEVEKNAWLIWTACVLLGLATGGWWQIGACTVLDDSGFQDFGRKWGLILSLNWIGMMIGTQFLAHFDMTQNAAIGFLIMTLTAVIASTLALFLDFCAKPVGRENRKLNDAKPSDE